jgi:hypothetical protein
VSVVIGIYDLAIFTACEYSFSREKALGLIKPPLSEAFLGVL